MWINIAPPSAQETSCSREPDELRALKQELSKVACKCNMCEAFKHPSRHRDPDIDQAVQVDYGNHHFDRYIYNAEMPEPSANMIDYFRKDVFCPNCYFIWDLLRKATKVFKDEVTETKPESSDKGTERQEILIDSSTSLTDFPNAKLSSILNRGTSEKTQKKSNMHNKIAFYDDCFKKEETKEDPPTFMIHGNCFCIDNFMDTIKPPM